MGGVAPESAKKILRGTWCNPVQLSATRCNDGRGVSRLLQRCCTACCTGREALKLDGAWSRFSSDFAVVCCILRTPFCSVRRVKFRLSGTAGGSAKTHLCDVGD